MSENGPSNAVLCSRCTFVCDLEDNFCRQCGLSLQEDNLPTVREGPRLPAVREISVPSVVAKGAAVVAAGTIAEALLRRVAGGIFRRGASKAKLPAKRAKGEVVPQDDEAPRGEEHVVSETFFVRRLLIRR